MDNKKLIENTLSELKGTYRPSDNEVFAEEVLRKAQTAASEKDTEKRTTAPMNVNEKRYGIMPRLGYILGAAAFIAVFAFGIKFVVENGVLKEGGPDAANSGTSATTSISEPAAESATTLTTEFAVTDTTPPESIITSGSDSAIVTPSESGSDDDVIPLPGNTDEPGIVLDPGDELPDGADDRTLQWANPGSGAGTDWDLQPWEWKFYDIPLELMVKVDGVLEYVEDCGGYLIADRYKEYTSAVYAEPEDRTNIDTGINVYTFINFFDISDDDVRDALADKNTIQGKFTAEEIGILLSGDKSAINKAFASKWAIVKGENIYSPYWLQNNSYDKWEAVGITAGDISSRFDELTDVPVYLVDEKFIPIYKAVLNNYLLYCERRAAGEDISIAGVKSAQATFAADINLLRDHIIDVEHYPDECSTIWGSCTADGSGFDWLTYGIKLKGFTENLNTYNNQRKTEFDTEALLEAVRPYCDENGNLLHNLLKMLPDVTRYDILNGNKLNHTESGYSNYLLGDGWLLEYYEYFDTVEIYRRSEHKTAFRGILELMWQKFGSKSGIAVAATDDFRGGGRESYLLIIADNKTLNSVKTYLSDNGADLSLCRFSTPEEVRSGWLPVTRLEYDGGEVYFRYPYSSDTYKWFADDDNGDGYNYYGVYTNRSREYDTLDEAADKLAGLGVQEETVQLVRTHSFESFIKTEPIYADIFDVTGLPTVYSGEKREYYGLGWDKYLILSVNSYSDGRQTYMIWEPETGIGLTTISQAVGFLRRHPEMDDDYNDFHFVIRKIELVYYHDSDSEYKNRIRIIADKKYHDNIQRFIQEEGIYYFDNIPDVGFIEFSDTEVDVSELEDRGEI